MENLPEIVGRERERGKIVIVGWERWKMKMKAKRKRKDFGGALLDSFFVM